MTGLSKSFIVSQSEVDVRLDKFLVSKIPDLHRRASHDLIIKGQVMVDKKLAKPSLHLKIGQVVTANINIEQEVSNESSVQLDIIWENNDVLVLNKPAGISVHPANNSDAPALTKPIIIKYPQIRDVGEDTDLRPGIVHRLDCDTSGVLIVAKSQKAFLWLKKQFGKRKVKKHYLALVHGKVNDEEGIIDMPLGRGKGIKRSIFARLLRPARTRFTVKRRFTDFTYLNVWPETGRTHQIRAHLANIGHAIIGDRIYSQKQASSPHGLSRQFLHANQLTIILPSGEEKTFFAPLPKDLASVLTKIR